MIYLVWKFLSSAFGKLLAVLAFAVSAFIVGNRKAQQEAKDKESARQFEIDVGKQLIKKMEERKNAEIENSKLSTIDITSRLRSDWKREES